VDLRHGNLYLHFGYSSYSSFVTAEYVESQLYSSSSFVVDICKPLRPMSDMTNLADQCCRSSPHHFGYYRRVFSHGGNSERRKGSDIKRDVL